MNETETKYSYQLLSRLLSDCNYYLAYGNRQPSCLRERDEAAHIAKMRRVYDSLPQPPEWLTREQIDDYARRMGVSTKQPADRVEVTYYGFNNFNVVADLPSRNIHLYLWWWNMEEAKKPDFEQQLDLICHIARTIEDIIRHMRINGHEVDYVPTDEVEG